jgi:hypothetical protein
MNYYIISIFLADIPLSIMQWSKTDDIVRMFYKIPELFDNK